jgi:hypothetical protein
MRAACDDCNCRLLEFSPPEDGDEFCDDGDNAVVPTGCDDGDTARLLRLPLPRACFDGDAEAGGGSEYVPGGAPVVLACVIFAARQRVAAEPPLVGVLPSLVGVLPSLVGVLPLAPLSPPPLAPLPPPSTPPAPPGAPPTATIAPASVVAAAATGERFRRDGFPSAEGGGLTAFEEPLDPTGDL